MVVIKRPHICARRNIFCFLMYIWAVSGRNLLKNIVLYSGSNDHSETKHFVNSKETPKNY